MKIAHITDMHKHIQIARNNTVNMKKRTI